MWYLDYSAVGGFQDFALWKYSDVISSCGFKDVVSSTILVLFV